MVVADGLVRDRFAEFHELAMSKGTLGGEVEKNQRKKTFASFGGSVVDPSSDAGLGSKSAGGSKAGFMREFFDDINEIQKALNQGRAGVKQMGQLLEDALQCTTQQQERDNSKRLQALVDENNERIKDIKFGLDQLKAKTDASKERSAAEAKIQTNMQQAMAKKLQTLLTDFQTAQIDFKRELERRQEKEMRILMPEVSEEERAQMIEDGQTTSMLIAQKMGGAHAMLLDEVERIREKHQAIQNLESNISDLCQMFNDMAVLVDSQGEMLDAIEMHVHKTKECTAKAEQELITTRKYQHKNKKQMCCLMAVCMVILLVILGPVLIANG